MQIWLWKFDGTLQCGLGEEISLDTMKKELTDLGIEVIDSKKGTAPVMVITMCGAPTGVANMYAIPDTTSRTQILQASQRGFKVMSVPELVTTALAQPPRAAGGGEVPFPLGVRAFGSNSVQPTLIRDIIGMFVRVYNEGEHVTMDYNPRRLNLVLDPRSHRIVDVYAG